MSVIRARRAIVVLATLSSSGCISGMQLGAASARPSPGRSFVADAPPGFEPRLLGVPLDANFHAAPGVGSLFPASGPLIPVPQNRFFSDKKLVTTGEELAANAQAWAVDANVSSSTHQRYAYFRAVQWTTAWELQTSGPMAEAPPWAVYYASKVYTGRSYVEVIQGDASTLGGSVAVHFMMVPVGGSISKFETDNHLIVHRAGAGFVPKPGKGAIFADTQQAIQDNYSTDGPEIAVAVEYTQLPRTQANAAEVFPAPKRITVRYTSLRVDRTGSEVKDYSTWSMTGGCFVNGEADAIPRPVLDARVGVGAWALGFTDVVYASDNDTLLCTAQGTYTRGLLSSRLNLGQSTTGSIPVSGIAGTVAGAMQGRDAETGYAIAWSATKEP
jgi:hypothetical protein